MLMAEVAPLHDDRTEVSSQPGSLSLLPARHRKASPVFLPPGRRIADSALDLIRALSDGDETARHQHDRRAGDERVNDGRDHQKARDDDGLLRRAERQIATDDPKHPDKRHRRDQGAEDADDEIDRRVGGYTRILTDAAFGILMVSRHQIELVIAAVGQPSTDQMVGQPRAPLPLGGHARVHGDNAQHHHGSHKRHEDEGLRRDRGPVLFLKGVEDVTAPDIHPVLESELDENERDEPEGEKPGGSAGVPKPEAAGTLPETSDQRSAGRYCRRRLIHYSAVRIWVTPIRHATFAAFIDLNHNTLWA